MTGSLSVSTTVWNALKALAEKENENFSRYVETVLTRHIDLAQGNKPRAWAADIKSALATHANTQREESGRALAAVEKRLTRLETRLARVEGRRAKEDARATRGEAKSRPHSLSEAPTHGHSHGHAPTHAHTHNPDATPEQAEAQRRQHAVQAAGLTMSHVFDYAETPTPDRPHGLYATGGGTDDRLWTRHADALQIPGIPSFADPSPASVVLAIELIATAEHRPYPEVLSDILPFAKA
jgi:ribosome-associated translation inhibitor RaiA